MEGTEMPDAAARECNGEPHVKGNVHPIDRSCGCVPIVQ